MIVRNVQIDCDHCGLPVPAGLIDHQRDRQFCCGGCHAAWELIHHNGLGSYYKLLSSSGANINPLDQRHPANFAEFDESSFHNKFVTRDNDNVSRVMLLLPGIHCAACIWLIEKLPAIVDGVVSATVNWSRGTVEILWQHDRIRLSRIASALSRLGYPPLATRRDAVSQGRREQNCCQLIRIGMAAAAAGNNMMIAAALYLGMFSFMSGDMETLLRLASCVVGTFSVLGPGRVFLRGAINSIVTRTPHMDLPIALGLFVGMIAGLVNTVRGIGEIWFDSLSVLVCLLLIGRWIQFRQQNRAADAVEMLYRLTPQRARKRVGDQVLDVAAEDLQRADVIEIRPGDLIAADGTVIFGETDVEECVLTGESRPVAKVAGDRVHAGTRNVTAPLLVRVEQAGDRTRISEIVGLVEQAAASKPQIVQWANRIGGWFVLIVLLLAAGNLIAWLAIDASRAVDRTVALLIVACPCALAMATPLAIAVALGRLAGRSILVKSGDVLQSLDRPGMIWLDKTGTLTTGKMECVTWLGDRSWIGPVAAIEEHFNHPIAQAFRNLASAESSHGDESGQTGMIVETVRQLDHGVRATVSGRVVLLGNRRLQESADISLDGWDCREREILDDAHSPCWISVDGEVVALAALGDSIRPDAAKVLDRLQARGWEIGILSGDHKDVVHSVATSLRIRHVHAGQTPEQKLAVIRKSMQDDRATVMVGDGVNDSAALAAATVGISVRNGAEASIAAAPVCLGTSGLRSIDDLFASARSTMDTMRLNFAVSLGYNLVGVLLAMNGTLNPLVAAILMPISSLTVISLSTRAAIGSPSGQPGYPADV